MDGYAQEKREFPMCGGCPLRVHRSVVTTSHLDQTVPGVRWGGHSRISLLVFSHPGAGNESDVGMYPPFFFRNEVHGKYVRATR